MAGRCRDFLSVFVGGVQLRAEETAERRLNVLSAAAGAASVGCDRRRHTLDAGLGGVATVAALAADGGEGRWREVLGAIGDVGVLVLVVISTFEAAALCSSGAGSESTSILP